MATNKKPNKHKPSINPLVKAKMEASFKLENDRARTAGVEYGMLAMRIASLMFYESSKDVSHSAYVDFLNKCRDIILAKKPIIDMMEEIRSMGYNVSSDRLVAMDPSLGQYM